MVIATTGKFDVLHHGHFLILHHLVTYCVNTQSVMLVLVDSDARIRKTTGLPPVFTAGERIEQLHALVRGISTRVDCTMYVFDYDAELEDTYRMRAETEKILLVKGEEWKGKPIIGKQYVDLYLFPTEKPKMSSTTIKQRIRQWYGDQEQNV